LIIAVIQSKPEKAAIAITEYYPNGNSVTWNYTGDSVGITFVGGKAVATLYRTIPNTRGRTPIMECSVDVVEWEGK